MKKLSVLFLVLFMFSFVAYGQMHLGLKAGLNIANIGGSDADQFIGQSLDTKTGFSGGTFFTYQFNNLFAIQPEAYYSMKGATYSENGGTLTISLDYVEVPVLFKLIIPVEGSNIRPSIFAGPAISFNTTHKMKIEYNDQTLEVDLNTILDTKSTDFSLVFGGGIDFAIGKNELGADIRYILGLSTWDGSSDPYDLKNSVINFNVYYGFSLP